MFDIVELSNTIFELQLENNINWRVTWFAPQIIYLLLIINWCSMKLIICLKFQEKIRGKFSIVYPVDVPAKISFQLIV